MGGVAGEPGAGARALVVVAQRLPAAGIEPLQGRFEVVVEDSGLAEPAGLRTG
jgi:hypothetical protein